LKTQGKTQTARTVRACSVAAAVGLVAIVVVRALPATAAPATDVDWRAVQPVASLEVSPLDPAKVPAEYRSRRDLFVLEGAVTDARSGHTLMNPRLIVTPGVPTSVEIGRQDELLLKLTVRVASRDEMSTTTELRRAGELISTSTTRFALRHD
jgi:hypothetical protein